MGCLVGGYFPEPVAVQWNAGAISTGIRTFPTLLDSSSGLYTLSSQLIVSATRWKSEKFQCMVEHANSSHRAQREIKPCTAETPTTPSTPTTPKVPKVHLFHSPCNLESSNVTIELLCIISNFFPGDVRVDWLVGERSGLVSSLTKPPRKDANGHTFSTTSTVNISQADWLNGNIYSCQVTHAATQTQVKSTAKKCEESSTGIKVFILHPTPSELYMDKQPKLTCVVVNLNSNSGLQVAWTRENSGALSPDPTVVKKEHNGTVTASSSVLISDTDWLRGETFTCTVNHPELTQAKNVRINQKKGDSAAPQVYLFHPHQEELNSADQHVSITALIKGFKPNDISLTWLNSDNNIVEDNYFNTPVTSEDDDTFFLYSRLKVKKTNWNNGDSYTLTIVHKGLRQKFIRKSITKSQAILVSTDGANDEQEEELESLWTTILIFFILFLLSLCYSATVTVFKVKWLFSTVMHLRKQRSSRKYKNVLRRAI